jgi:hypothetical protein
MTLLRMSSLVVLASLFLSMLILFWLVCHVQADPDVVCLVVVLLARLVKLSRDAAMPVILWLARLGMAVTVRHDGSGLARSVHV